MPVITPNIPEGLIELMKSFAKCVLKEKPENIYEFSVVHFEKLLQERDGDLNKGYERFAASEKYIEAREKCLMSQIISHLNKKRRPDSVKIPPYDSAEDISLSETLSPKSLQQKFRPRKLSSRKASEVLLSIKEEDEGHNPAEDLALQHRKLTAARKIQRAYKSYKKRKEERENGAALVIQRTLKKLFGTKLGVKVLHNDGESTCNNIQNDSGVESDVPKDETDAEQENHKELNVCDEKYMDSVLGINSIITQQVPSFTEDERRSQNLEADKVENPSVGYLDKAHTVDQKEKSVDGESSVHKSSKIESSACKQLDIEDVAEVNAANHKLDHNQTTDEVVKAEILKDVEESLKTGADEAGKSILEREGRFVSNDTNNIGSAESVSDVQYKKFDDTENKGNGFPEAILEEVARNGSKNDISKETIEFVKSPRENEDGKQNSEENINNDNNDKIEIQNEFNNEQNDNASKDKKQQEHEASSQNRNDTGENQSQLNLAENEKGSEGNKKMQIESTMNDEVKSEDAKRINSDKHIDINGTNHDNEENKDVDNNPSLKTDEDSVAPKSVWYVGSEPIITSKSSEEKDDSNSLENISTTFNEKSQPEKIEQENNSPINESSKTDAVNEKIGSNSNDFNQEIHNINTENETSIERCEAEAENIESWNNKENEILSKVGENDGIKNGEIIIKTHAEVDGADLPIPETTESSVERLENSEEKDGDTAEVQNEEKGEHNEGDEGEKDNIISEGTERSVDNFKNEGEKGEQVSESSVEKHINDIGPDKNVVDEDLIAMQNEQISISKQVEGDEENETISETGRNTENLKTEQEISSLVTGSGKGAVEIQNEKISGRKSVESPEGEKDKNLKEANENSIENIKNDEDKEEEKGRVVSSDSNSVEKEDTSVHNEIDDGDKNNNIPKITESSTDILKNDEEKEETLNKKSPEDVKESHIAQDRPTNLDELDNKVETEKYAEETKHGNGNEENTHNNTVLNEESLLSEDKNEGEVDSQNEGSKVLSGDYEDGTNINKAEVIEEIIKKVVAPSRYASPDKISSAVGEEKYKNLEASEDKIIAKELLQHASVEDLGMLLKEEQNKSEEQVAQDAKTAELETNLTDSNTKNLESNHLEDDGSFDSKSPESNTSKENNKLDEDGDESRKIISSKRNSKAETNEAEIQKLESESLNSESPNLEPNKEELSVTNENTNGIAKKNLNDQILESTQLGQNENLRLDLKDDKEKKKKEEGAFEGFIVEPAFKDNDGGNTVINPEDNVKKDSTETSEADIITEEQEDRPLLNAPESQGTEESKDHTPNYSNSENKKEILDVDEGQAGLQKYPEKIGKGQSAENDVKNESDLQISNDNKKESLHLEENEAGSPTPDNELNNKDNQIDEANTSQQIEEKEENHPPKENIVDAEYSKKELNSPNELTIDHQLPREEKEGSSIENDEQNFENTKEIVKPSNKEYQHKTVERTELEKPVEKIELEELNADQKSENIGELNENMEDKEVSDEEDTEFSQDTVEEAQPSESIKSIIEENPKQNVDVEVETKDSEKETKTTHSLEKPSEKTEIENPLTKIDDGGDICVGNSKENSGEFNKEIADIVNKDEEKGEHKEIMIKVKEDNRKNSSDLSQPNAENSLNETGRGSGVETNMENHEIQRKPEETKNEDNHNKEQSQIETTNQKSIIDETGAVSIEPTELQIDETRNGLDDETKNQNSMDTNKSTEQAIILEKEEDTKNSKEEEDEDKNANNNEKEYTDNSTQLNKTYTISKNKPEETPDYNEENHKLKRQISSSSSLLNTLSNETSADNELLSQKSTEKPQGEEMVEVQEEPNVKQIISQTETSKVQPAHLSDIEINKQQQNSATLNNQSNEINAGNEDFTEKCVNKEIKAEINEEPSAKQLGTTSEIHSAPLSLSDAETTRVESRSTINDELSEIENIDISTYGEDSLEAMYYSLRKNEIMLDRMQKRASERKSASKERGPIEKLDLRQVKSMSEMDRSMSINSDDDVVIKTLERNRSNDNDIEQFNNPISVVAQNTARLLESLHQMNSNPVRPPSASFEEERVVRQPCRVYSPSIRMKSRIPTPVKDIPKSVSFETPLAAVQRKSQKFMQLLHNDTQSSETVDSLLDQKETSDTIRQKMLAYSVSEADSDYCAEAEKKMSIRHDDSNVSTALETASTDTDSTIVSAATKIQAGARGFLTRRRLRRASDGALPQGSERKASFGNEAIGESLEDLVEQNAASKIQKSYRRYLGNKQHKSESSKPSPETSSSSKSSDGSKPVGITQVKIGQKLDRDETDDAKKADDIDDGYHGAYFEGLNLAERRLTLQRGDAVQKYSTPEEENGFSQTNERQVSDAGDSKPSTSPKKRKSVKNDMWRNFGLRQRTMPVQIESDILRVVPKHMRKRIKSADAQKKSRQVMQ